MKEELELDISEEMAMELSDMLAVALHFAGVKEECLQDAMNVYVEALDYFDDNAEYNKEAMIKIIEDMKKNNKNLFF